MQVEEDAPSKPILGTIKDYEEGSPNKGNLRRKGRESWKAAAEVIANHITITNHNFKFDYKSQSQLLDWLLIID